MLIAERLWPIFLAHLKANQVLSQSLHRYDPYVDKIVVSRSSTVSKFTGKLVISFLFVFVLSAQLITYRSKFPLSYQVQCVFFIVSYGSHWLIAWTIWRKSGQLASLVNSMLQFEKEFNDKNWAPKRGNSGKKARHAIKPFLISGFLFSIFVGSYLWTDPCHIGFFGFTLLPQCHQSSSSDSLESFNLVLKAVLTLFQAWNVNFLVGNGCYYAGQFIYMICHCISNYLCLLSRKKCLETSSTSYKTIHEILHSYSMIRLLTITYNDINSFALGVVVSTNTFLIILALYAILSANVTGFQLLFLFISAFDRTLVIKEAFETMGVVYQTSVISLMKIKSAHMTTTTQIVFTSSSDQLSRKILESLPCVRITVGKGVSYFDGMFVPINIDFVIKQTASILLVQ